MQKEMRKECKHFIIKKNQPIIKEDGSAGNEGQTSYETSRKFLSIYLTQEGYSENNKTPSKEIKEETNKRQRIPCSWIGKLNIVRYEYYPK